VLGLVLLVLVAVLILGRTEFGTREVGERAVAFLDSKIAGDLRVGRVSGGGIFRGVMLHDVVLEDSLGRPFLRADSARLGYNLRTLIGGDVVLNRVELWSPYAVLERMPGDSVWNFERAFASGAPDTASSPGEGSSLVLLERAVVHDGTVLLRTPWEPDPDEPVEPSDTARLMLDHTPAGVVREMRFESIDAALPRLVIESPGEEGRLFRIQRLSTDAYVYETPARIEHVQGVVTMRDSLVSFELDELRLPETRASGVGRLRTEPETRLDLELDIDRVAMSDLRWLRPDLPAQGGGSGILRVLQRDDGSTLVQARQLDLQGPGTRMRGSFGIVTGDSLYFTGVDLEADPVDLDFVGSLLPGGLPVEGLMIGNVRVQGPISSLRSSGDARLSHADRGGWTRARWNGTLDLQRRSVHALEIDFTGLDTALIARIAPEQLRLDRPADGRLLANGSLDGRLEIDAELRLPEQAGEERVAGRVIVDRTDTGHRVDVSVDADRYALRRLYRFVPELSILGDAASGPVHVVSASDTVWVDARVRAADGGLVVAGVFPRGDSLGFDLRIDLDDVALERVLEPMPVSRASGVVRVTGRPGEPGTRLAVDLAGGHFMGVPLREGRFGGRLLDGVLHVDSLRLQSAAGRIAATGRLGIDEGAIGALRVRALADSALALSPMLGLPLEERLLRGSADFDGVLAGNYRDFRIQGTGRMTDAWFRGLSAPAGDYRVTFDWAAGTSPAVQLTAAAERATLGERRLGVIELTGDLDRRGAGTVAVRVRTPFEQRYELVADYDGIGDTTATHVRTLSLSEGDHHWRLAAPALVRLDARGAHVQSLTLDRENGGRVRVAGLVPWRAPWIEPPPLGLDVGVQAAGGVSGSARRLLSALGQGFRGLSGRVAPGGSSGGALPLRVDLTVSAEDAPLAALVHLVEPESTLDGLLLGTLRLRGPAIDPVIEAEGVLREFRYEDVELERVSGRMHYRDRVAHAAVDAFRDGRAVVQAELELPGEIRMAPLDVRRLPLPTSGRIVADQMPAALPAGLVEGLEDVRGEISGELIIGGTPFDLSLDGELEVTRGAFTVAEAGVRYTGVAGVVRVLGDQELEVEGRGRTEGGSARVRGRIGLARLDDPTFDVRLDARHLQLSRRRDLEASVTGWAQLTGSYRAPRLAGHMTVDQGSLDLDELVREAMVVGLQNPLLMEAVDTSQVAVRRILRENQNPFLAGLVLNLDADVRGNFWVRSEVLNIEVAGDVLLDYASEAQDITMVGRLDATRGFYNFRVGGFPIRRFAVRSGAIEFVGVPGINPNLDVTAAYRARTTNGDPLDIMAIVDGTMRAPQVRLTSDADPPIAESDLASYIIFGRPTYALSQGEARALGDGVRDNLTAATVSTVANFGIPLALTYASSEVEAVASEFGIDYVSISNEDLVDQALNYGWQPDELFVGTRFELGRYFGDEWFVAFTPKVVPSTDSNTIAPGGRIEWRFHPTWNAEAFWEDRLAQAANSGFDRNLESRAVLGLFLFREWGY